MMYFVFAIFFVAVLALAKENDNNAMKEEILLSLETALTGKEQSLADQGMRLRNADGTGWCWVWECSCRGM
jgi:hypothetical protein